MGGKVEDNLGRRQPTGGRAVDQGLSSAIFTDSVRASEAFLSPLGSDCGIANVNIDMIGRNAPEKLLITPTKALEHYNGLVRLAETLAPLYFHPGHWAPWLVAGAVALLQRGQDRGGGVQAGEKVGHGHAHFLGPAAGPVVVDLAPPPQISNDYVLSGTATAASLPRR